MEKQGWWHWEKKGLSLQPEHSKPPQHPVCCSSSEQQCSGLVGPGSNRLLSRREGALQKVRYSLQEADRPVEVRGERLHVWLITKCINSALSALHHPSQGHQHCTPRGHLELNRGASAHPVRRGAWASCLSTAHGYCCLFSAWGKPAWCSQHHPWGRVTWPQAGPAGATRSSDNFPLLMLNMGSSTARPDQSFLPWYFLTSPPGSLAATACQSQTLPAAPVSLAWTNKPKIFSKS